MSHSVENVLKKAKMDHFKDQWNENCSLCAIQPVLSIGDDHGSFDSFYWTEDTLTLSQIDDFDWPEVLPVESFYVIFE